MYGSIYRPANAVRIGRRRAERSYRGAVIANPRMHHGTTLEPKESTCGHKERVYRIITTTVRVT